jgi:glucose-6-phosphate 1-dehydrogenase
MNFCYRDRFVQDWPGAYEKLLQDVLDGDHSLFVNAEETELAWQKIARALDLTASGFYDPGTLPESRIGASWMDFQLYCKPR